MNKRAFRILMEELELRVKQEGKKNPSWLFGYLQGKGNEKLTGYQIAALIDLLLVPLEKELVAKAEPVPEQKEEHPEEKEESVPDPVPEQKQSSRIPGNLLKTLAQR